MPCGGERGRYERRLAPVYGDVGAPAEVFGVHGATGLTRWKRLAARHELRGEWEAVEWASVPPGGMSGEHRHTRTEEVYFILSGLGEFIVNGRTHVAHPGSLLLTGLGATHGLRNTGRLDLDWLVIELPTPRTSAVLRGHCGHQMEQSGGKARTARDFQDEAANGETDMISIHNLAEERELDPRGVLTGPLTSLSIVILASAERRRLDGLGSESAWFVLRGSGSVASGSVSRPLRPGNSVALPLGSEAVATAGAEGLELFRAELAVSDV